MTEILHDVEKRLPINLLKSELWYSNPFQNAACRMNDDCQIMVY